MAIPYEEYPRSDLLVQIVVQFVFIFIIGILLIWLVKKYAEKRVEEVKILLYFLILLEISTIAAWYPKILNYWAISTDWIYGFPVGGGRRLWWTNFSYIFNTMSSIYLIIFTHLLFKIDKPRIIKIYILAVIGFNILSIYHGIFVYEPGASSLTFPMSVYLILLGTYSMGYLFWYTKRDLKKLSPSIYRFGYQMFYYATCLGLIAYFVWVLSIVLPVPKWAASISWVINTFVMIFLSLGLTLPVWLRKWAAQRYSFDLNE